MAKQIQPLSTKEIEQFSTTFGAFFDRLAVTVAQAEHMQAVQSNLADLLRRSVAVAGIERTARAKSDGEVKTAKRSRRRASKKIEPEKVVAAVKAAGAKGATSGKIAAALGVPVGRLRFVLYKLRDEGSLRMEGALSKARYLAPAAPSAAPTPKGAKKATTKKASPKKTAARKKPSAKKAGAKKAPAVAAATATEKAVEQTAS